MSDFTLLIISKIAFSAASAGAPIVSFIFFKSLPAMVCNAAKLCISEMRVCTRGREN